VAIPEYNDGWTTIKYGDDSSITLRYLIEEYEYRRGKRKRINIKLFDGDTLILDECVENLDGKTPDKAMLSMGIAYCGYRLQRTYEDRLNNLKHLFYLSENDIEEDDSIYDHEDEIQDIDMWQSYYEMMAQNRK